MNNELVIDAQSDEVSIALIEDGKLVELNKENAKASFSVGDIYLAKVKKIMPGLNAAFVDVGYERGAFLHYQDLGPQFKSLVAYSKTLVASQKPLSLSKFQLQKDIEKTGVITDVLDNGMEILVQIAKEPISTKGPRLTSEISIAGRFLVLMPFANKVFVSQKIKSNDERNRIKQIIRKFKPQNFGVIVRTVAEGISADELQQEMVFLVNKWRDAIAKINIKAKLPQLLYQESSRSVSILRDIFNPSFDKIYVNDKSTFNEICDYVKLIAPEKKDIVKLYDDDKPIFDYFNITKQLKSSFGRTVSFKNGAYLIIERTEAMHVIDVNSGNKSKAGYDQEMSAVECNLAAADEIAHQLRLRDIGGIIVIDFIDMVKPENRQRLYERMRENMAHDRAKHNILQLSKFGLMQITRQRVRPEMKVQTEEVCPTCMGKGVAQPSFLFTEELEGKIDFVKNTLKVNDFKLYVHPYVFSYLNQGFFFSSIKWKLKRKYGSFKLYSDQSLGFLQYRFVDNGGEPIHLHDNPDLDQLDLKDLD